MTIATYKAGILAADSWSTSSGTVVATTTNKAVRSKKGIVGACTGWASFCESFRQWVLSECKGKLKFPEDASGMIVRPGSDKIEVWDQQGVAYFNEPYYAIGCGRDYALGAMAVGACATQAVEAAIKHDTHCGGAVNYVKR